MKRATTVRSARSAATSVLLAAVLSVVILAPVTRAALAARIAQREAAHTKLSSWIKQVGLVPDTSVHEELRHLGDGQFGMVATKDLAKDEAVVQLNLKKVLLGLFSARATPLREHVDWDTIAAHRDIVTAALLLERLKPSGTSPWSAYLDALPQEEDMLGFPFKWTEEELNELQGSPLPLLMEREIDSMDKLYQIEYKQHLTTKLPELFPASAMTSDLFAWASLSVGDRAMHLPIPGVPRGSLFENETMPGLVPWADAHRIALNANLAVDVTGASLTLRTTRAVAAGTELTLLHGRAGRGLASGTSNAEMLLTHGVSLAANPDPVLFMPLFDGPDMGPDKLLAQKIEWISKADLLDPYKFWYSSVGFSPATKALLRVKWITDEDKLDAMEKAFFYPIDEENEGLVHLELLSYLAKMEKLYQDTTIEQDEEILASGQYAARPNMRAAVAQRLEEKRLLRTAIQELQDSPALHRLNEIIAADTQTAREAAAGSEAAGHDAGDVPHDTEEDVEIVELDD